MPTVMGPSGSPMNIDPPRREDYLNYLKHKDDPPTPEDVERWKKLDESLGAILLEKMLALGHEATLDEAIVIFNDPKLRNKRIQIEKEYDDLAAQGRMNEMIASMTNLHRNFGGKEF